MADKLEIRSIKIVPYTLMTSSISAVWAFIFAIIFLLFAGATAALFSSIPLTNVTGVPYFSMGAFATMIVAFSVALLIMAPVYAFIGNIATAFLITLIYNLLVPRLNGIQLKVEDLRHIKEIPVVPFALITAAVAGVLAFIFALIYGPYFGAITSISSAFAGILTAIGIIILMPIVAFIVVFIVMAISAFLYNFLAPIVGGVKFNFVNVKEAWFGIDSIEIIPFALILAVIFAIWGLLVGIIWLIIFLIAGSAVSGIIALIAIPIIDFIVVFIVLAITAFIYNFLAPRIGSVKLELE